MPWKKISSVSKYKSEWTELTVDELELANGKRLLWDVVHKKPFAMIVPWDGERLTLVGQYRYCIDTFSWEFPAGYCDFESPEKTATVELRQETGLSAGSMQRIGSFYSSSGFTNCQATLFFATDLEQGQPEREETEEGMQIKQVTLEEFSQMIREGKITDAPTLASLTLLRERKLLRLK